MSALYIETSAILSWLLGESGTSEVIDILNKYDIIVSSVLSILETERAFIRAKQGNIIKESDHFKLKGIFARHVSTWNLLEINTAVRNRAAQSFPVEPIRSLDAIHLATALEFLQIMPELSILSFDKRILDNITPLGLKSV